MPRIQLLIEQNGFIKAGDTIHNIVTKAINKDGGFTQIQTSAIANSLTKTLHKYILNIQNIAGQPQYRFWATGQLQSNAGSHIFKYGEQRTENGFNYVFGLSMEKYGWILGSEGFMLTRGAIPGLVLWLKAKVHKGIQFVMYKWVRIKGTKKWKRGGETRPPETERDYVSLATQIVMGMQREHKMSTTINKWYKDALMPYGDGRGNVDFNKDVMENIVRSKNLIPAVKKRIIDNINKRK